MNIDTKQYGKLHLQGGRTVEDFQTLSWWSVKIPPVLSAISSTFYTLNVVGS